MKVHFEIPDHVWARVVDIAEQRGTTAAHILSAATTSLMQFDTSRKVKSQARQKRVTDLVKHGFTDAEVANMTGELVQYVRNTRYRFELPANKRPA